MQTKSVPDTILDRLRKIAALATSGVDGERSNAARMLDELCAKHGITREDIASEERSFHPFTVRDPHEVTLIHQVIWHICRTYKVRHTYCRRLGQWSFELTIPQAIAVRECFTHYQAEWRKLKRSHFKNLLEAFVHTNKLYGPEAESQATGNSDPAEIRRILALMRTLDATPWTHRPKLPAHV